MRTRKEECGRGGLFVSEPSSKFVVLVHSKGCVVQYAWTVCFCVSELSHTPVTDARSMPPSMR